MHSRCSWLVAVAGVAAATLAACMADPIGPGMEASEPAVTSTTQALFSCPDNYCGANSPEVDNKYLFHDLSVVGTSKTPGTTVPNEAGLAIVAAGEGRRAQIVQRGQSYDLAVVDGRFVGTARGLPPLVDKDLIGAAITLTLDGPNGPVPSYQITIGNVRDMPFFRGGGTTTAYTLLWSSVHGGPRTNLCNNIKLLESLLAKEAGDGEYLQSELMGMLTIETVVFEGDRIFRNTMRMAPTADDTWFNIGCASHTLSKLRLTRNTVHGQAAGLPQAWERRQATLKLLVADYCDAGIGLTVTGQRLVWQGDLMGYHSAPKKIEARWTERGAACLYAPRMLYPTSAYGASKFPDAWDAVDAACKSVGKPRPPTCTNLDPLDYDGTLRASANPKI